MNLQTLQVGLHSAVEARIENKPSNKNDFIAKKTAELSSRKVQVVRQRLEAMIALLPTPPPGHDNTPPAASSVFEGEATPMQV